MTYIRQYLLDVLEQNHEPNKVLVVYGSRRVGKTTLLNKLLEKRKKYLSVSGEDIDVQHYLSSQSITKLKSFIGNHTLLVIDEAQKIHHVGQNLKLLVDHCPGLQIIVTGSSAFDLGNHLGEPLTGRKITYKMFPLSQIELSKIENLSQTRGHLESRLIFGSYPEVVLMNSDEKKKEFLHELVTSYLYKDILELEGIRKSKKITHILQLLAFQVGKEVSISEIASQVGISKGTVDRYLDLLEKSFVLINLQGFSRNLRKELTKKPRYYFYDTGIRNALINQFNPLSLRNDIGELWENYLVVERLKKQEYQRLFSNNYFWRTYNQQEIDWIEERDGKLFAYEFKWRDPKIKVPSEWRQAYGDENFEVIHRENYLPFITDD